MSESWAVGGMRRNFSSGSFGTDDDNFGGGDRVRYDRVVRRTSSNGSISGKKANGWKSDDPPSFLLRVCARMSICLPFPLMLRAIVMHPFLRCSFD